MQVAVPFIDRRAALGRVGGVLLVLGAGPVSADDSFPNKPIRIVPFGTAGGPIDAIARSYGEALKQRWNQPVIVDAKPGASGIVATDFVAKAPPDGYTLMLTLSLTHTTVPLLQQKVPYDPVRDFQPLTKIATGGPMFVVPANAPPNNLTEFVAWAKSKGRVTYGTWGNGSRGPPVRRAVQAPDRRADGTRALQGRGGGAPGHVRRRARHRVGQSGHRAHAPAGRQDQGAGHHRLAPRRHDCQRAHLHRAGLRRLRARQLAGLLRAGAHAGSGGRQARDGAARGHAVARAAHQAARHGVRTAGQHTRRVRQRHQEPVPAWAALVKAAGVVPE